jgi:hypothetical protein
MMGSSPPSAQPLHSLDHRLRIADLLEEADAPRDLIGFLRDGSGSFSERAFAGPTDQRRAQNLKRYQYLLHLCDNVSNAAG